MSNFWNQLIHREIDLSTIWKSEASDELPIITQLSNVYNSGWKIVEMCEKEGIFSKSFDMFVWTIGFQKSLAQTDYNMFVDEC